MKNLRLLLISSTLFFSLVSCSKEDVLSTDLENDRIEMTLSDKMVTFHINYTTEKESWEILYDIKDSYYAGYYAASASGSKGQYSYTASISAIIVAYHVGQTTFIIRAGDVYKEIQVNIVPEYYTYSEPTIDFDDTKDSVIVKCGHNYTMDILNGTIESVIDGPRGEFTLKVYLDQQGVVSKFVVRLAAPSVDLEAFLSERYHKVEDAHQGRPAWLKAFDNPTPSISESLYGVVISEENREVTYLKPIDI